MATVAPEKEKTMAETATVMAEEVQPETKKAFMSKKYSREERLKKDEEELEQLLKEQKGEVEEPVKEEEQEPESAEEKTFKKRYSDLRRHQQQQAEDFKKEIEGLRQQLDSATKKEMKLPKSDEELESWMGEYPDVAAIVESIAMKKAKEQSIALEERMKAIDEMQQSASKEKAEAELMRIHPDFDDIRESDDFHQWADEQPKWVQNALYENDNDAKAAARAIDLYKADKGITKEKPKSDKEAAKSVSTKNSRSKPQQDESSSYLKESDVQKMSAQEYEKNSDEIMEAIRSGKFIYDISGSAR
jgi:hypothetical protein